MKVLLVHLSDGHKGGGGGVSLGRLQKGLRNEGVDAQVLCRTRTSDSSHVFEIPRMPKIEYPIKRVTSKMGLNDIHLLGSFKVRKMDVFREADVVDFQGIHTNTLSYLSLPWLTRDKPSIFTMHDMWAATGHCSSSYTCKRWKTGCGQCPFLEIHPAIKRDNTHIEWLLKKWSYQHSNLVFVANSRWIADVAKQSIFNQFPVYLIPNGVNTEVFRPYDQAVCREKIGIPLKKKVLLFSALKLDSYLKGSDLLITALKGLPTSLKSEVLLLTVGNGPTSLFADTGVQTINLGFVTDDHARAIAYAAADLLVFPTRAESFGLVSIESQACGTPVVSFRVGGVPDHVRPGQTGYLAEPEDAADFREGIVSLLGDEALRNRMRQQCRTMVENEFRFDLRVQRYVKLYERVMKNESATLPTTFPIEQVT